MYIQPTYDYVKDLDYIQSEPESYCIQFSNGIVFNTNTRQFVCYDTITYPTFSSSFDVIKCKSF